MRLLTVWFRTRKPSSVDLFLLSQGEHLKSLPIGIFDSGIGGLTVVREFVRKLPHEDIIYLGDTARVPYGNKSPATVIRFACEDTAFLVGQRVKAVVVACNTASAWALGELERRFNVPIFGVILPGVRAALASTRNRQIGVIATSATIRSQAYTRAILARCDSARVVAVAAPLLVPLVEEGWLNRPVTHSVLREYLAPVLSRRIDTLVLGCTHYPLLKPAIRKVVGPEIRLVDSAQSCAEFVAERLACLNLLQTRRRRPGRVTAFVTDETERFSEQAVRFMGQGIAPARKAAVGGDREN